jgi:type IV pilus assembly protein PilA
MFTKIQKRMKGEKGFTLIELLVVIIIIAILAAIAIPTFLGQRSKAQDASAKSLVRNAMTAMESAYVDSRTYDPDVVDTDVLAAIEPSITFTADDAAVATWDGTDATVAEVGDADAEEVGYFGDDTSYSIATTSLSGNLFGVTADKSATGATTFVKKIGDADVTTGW